MSSKARPSLEPGLVRPGMINAIRFFALVAMGISAYLA